MSFRNFEASLVKVLRHEGGFFDHPKDPGGATNMGITHRVLSAWRRKPVTKQDVKNLTKEEATKIYRSQYWMPIRGDELPDGVDYVVFDYAVNAGVAQAAKTLQRIVGVKADGVIGAITLAAVERYNPSELIRAFSAKRIGFYQSLVTFKWFGRGWTRRVREAEQAALLMVA